MKKLYGIFILSLILCKVVSAELISLNNIKIGDKVSKHFTHKQISEYYLYSAEKNSKGEQLVGKNLKYSAIAFRSQEIIKEAYHTVQIYFENKTDKIVSIAAIDLTSNLSDCIKKRNKYAATFETNTTDSLLIKDEGRHKFPDGMIDDNISYSGHHEIFLFNCYHYQNGETYYRFQKYETEFNDWMFKKFNE